MLASQASSLTVRFTLGAALVLTTLRCTIGLGHNGNTGLEGTRRSSATKHPMLDEGSRHHTAGKAAEPQRTVLVEASGTLVRKHQAYRLASDAAEPEAASFQIYDTQPAEVSTTDMATYGHHGEEGRDIADADRQDEQPPYLEGFQDDKCEAYLGGYILPAKPSIKDEDCLPVKYSDSHTHGMAEMLGIKMGITFNCRRASLVIAVHFGEECEKGADDQFLMRLSIPDAYDLAEGKCVKALHYPANQVEYLRIVGHRQVEHWPRCMVDYTWLVLVICGSVLLGGVLLVCCIAAVRMLCMTRKSKGLLDESGDMLPPTNDEADDTAENVEAEEQGQTALEF